MADPVDPADEAAAALLRAELPDLMNLIEAKFAAHPGLVLDFLAQALCLRAQLAGLPRDEALATITQHWDEAARVIREAVALVAKSPIGGSA